MLWFPMVVKAIYGVCFQPMDFSNLILARADNMKEYKFFKAYFHLFLY